MVAKVAPRMVKQRQVQEYNCEWEIKNLNRFDSKCIRTEAFSPIFNVNASFCFEIYYQQFPSESSECAYSCFKLSLIKLFGSDIPSQLEMTVDVRLNYNSNSFFKEYKLPPRTKAAEMDIYNFRSEIIYAQGDNYNINHEYIRSGFILDCHMTFFDGLYSPQLLSHYQRWVKNVEDFAGDVQDFCSSSTFSDVKINVDKKTIPAHKIVLAAHSPVFMKMLTTDFKESTTNCIDIGDVSFGIFEHFLKYLYSGKIGAQSDVDFTEMKELYILAHLYDVSALKQECVLKIPQLLTLDNVCDALRIAYKYDDDNLKENAKNFAAGHMEDLITSENWKQLVKDFPEAGYEVMLNFFPRKQKG